MDILKALVKAKINIQHNVKHKHYAQTIKLRKFYLQCITGDNIDDLLPQFERREDVALWKQRQQITIENLSPTVAPVLNKFYKVGRMAPRKEIKGQNDADTKILRALEAAFYGESDVENYLTTVIDDIAQYDPNAFLMVDFAPFEPGDSAEPFPVIFNCDEVLDFYFTRKGVLDYVFTKYETTVYEEGTVQKAKVKDFYFVIEGANYQFSEVHPYRKFDPNTPVLEQWRVPGGEKVYNIYKRETGSQREGITNQIAAKRIGYIKSKSYPGICVAPLQPAKPYLRDIIRHKSGYDVSMLEHVFPHMLMYGVPCPGEPGGRGKEALVCVDGRLGGPTGPVCKTCGGLGLKPHRSAQDIWYIKLPRSDEKPMPLKDYMYYAQPELGTVDKLTTTLDALEKKIFVAVFSTDLMRRTNGTVGDAASATEVGVKKDDINDTLLPYSQQRANIFKFIVGCTAMFNDIKPEITFEYPKELEVESVAELLEKITAMTNGNVSEIIIQELELAIAKQQFDNDPVAMARYLVQRRFLPFKGKSETIINACLAGTYVPDLIKCVYSCFNLIFEELEADDAGKSFYTLGYTDQWNKVKEVAQRLLDQAKKDAPPPMTVPKFNTPKPQPSNN